MFTSSKLRNAPNSIYIYLIYEGVVNKFACEVFGGVSWKFGMKLFIYIATVIVNSDFFFLTNDPSDLIKNNHNIRQHCNKHLTVNDQFRWTILYS